ncbi:MAG: hypothetical protein ABL964_03910 [Steroidobacteraceae bacterium]
MSHARGTVQVESRLFYALMSGALLLIVLLGFGRSLYLRPFTDLPPLPVAVVIHGSILTAWYVGAFAQATLVSTGRTDLHRRMGWWIAGIGAAVIVIGTTVTFAFVGRRAALGTDIEARIRFFSDIVWGDIAAMVAFAVFFCLALAWRKRPDLHKRLMILGSLALLEPALFRIWGWKLFAGVDRNWAALVVLFVAMVVLALHDLSTRKKVLPVTLLGGALLIGSRMLGLFVVAHSAMGLALIRALI